MISLFNRTHEVPSLRITTLIGCLTVVGVIILVTWSVVNHKKSSLSQIDCATPLSKSDFNNIIPAVKLRILDKSTSCVEKFARANITYVTIKSADVWDMQIASSNFVTPKNRIRVLLRNGIVVDVIDPVLKQ
jgi:hypothetical protein